jgi:hypothetical protein
MATRVHYLEISFSQDKVLKVCPQRFMFVPAAASSDSTSTSHVSRKQRFDILLEVTRDDLLQRLMRICLIAGVRASCSGRAIVAKASSSWGSKCVLRSHPMSDSNFTSKRSGKYAFSTRVSALLFRIIFAILKPEYPWPTQE